MPSAAALVSFLLVGDDAASDSRRTSTIEDEDTPS